MARTWGEIEAEIRSECNIQTESFVTAVDLLGWANDAVRICEKEISTLYDKYFEAERAISGVATQMIFDLPTDILATKITGLYFKGASETYEIKFIKDKIKLLSIGSNDRHGYRLTNPVGGSVIKLYPPLRESGYVLYLFYIRRAQLFEDLMSPCDVPIAEGFIKQYVKDKIKEKEIGPMGEGVMSPLLIAERDLMVSALSEMVPDDSKGEIEPDTTFYDDVGEYF